MLPRPRVIIQVVVRREEPHASERATWDPPEGDEGSPAGPVFSDGEATIAYGGRPSSIPAASFDDDEATTFDAGKVPERPTEPVPAAKPKPHLRTGGSLGRAAASESVPDSMPPVERAALVQGHREPGDGPTQTFGRFTLGPPVGGGGMAEVRLGYEHRPDGTTQPVVIKRIARSYVNQQKYQEMFKEAVRLSRLLRHPNIVQAYEDGVEDGVPFIAFELIDGVTVADLKKLGGKVPVGVALEVAESVLMGLEYAHQVANDRGRALGLVHRDISPQNILISRRGEVKIVDFGIARFEGREHMTMAGEVKGKMRYMAPEQLAEKPMDGRTDLFALGIVLGELLSVLEDGLTEHFCSGIKKVAPALPTRFHDFLLSLTKPKPEERPTSATEALEEVRILRERLTGDPSLLEFAARSVFPKRESLMNEEAPRRATPKVQISWGGDNTELGDDLPDDVPEDHDGAGPDEGESQLGYADTVLRHRHLLPEMKPNPQVETVPPPRAATARSRPQTPPPVATPKPFPTPRPMKRPDTPAPVMVTPARMPEPPNAPPGPDPMHNPYYAPPGMMPPGAYPMSPMGEQLMPPQPISGVHTHPGFYTHPGYPQAQMPPPNAGSSAIWPLAIAVGALALVLLGLVLVVLTR